jgi:hypothetical protein
MHRCCDIGEEHHDPDRKDRIPVPVTENVVQQRPLHLRQVNLSGGKKDERPKRNMSQTVRRRPPPPLNFHADGKGGQEFDDGDDPRPVFQPPSEIGAAQHQCDPRCSRHPFAQAHQQRQQGIELHFDVERPFRPDQARKRLRRDPEHTDFGQAGHMARECGATDHDRKIQRPYSQHAVEKEGRDPVRPLGLRP